MTTVNVFRFTKRNITDALPFADEYVIAPTNPGENFTSLSYLKRKVRLILNETARSPSFHRLNNTVIFIDDNMYHWLAAMQIQSAFKACNNDVKIWITGRPAFYVDTWDFTVDGNDWGKCLEFEEIESIRIDNALRSIGS